MTYRYYLRDAVFAVVMALGSKQAELLPEALQNPVWDLYLGRKSCVPTELIYQGIFDSAESAWQQAQKLADSKQRALSYTVMEGKGMAMSSRLMMSRCSLAGISVIGIAR